LAFIAYESALVIVDIEKDNSSAHSQEQRHHSLCIKLLIPSENSKNTGQQAQIPSQTMEQSSHH